MRHARFLVKFNRHSGEYGIHDRAARETRWRMGLAQATSQAARQNAVDEVHAALNQAIGAISTILTGTTTLARRQAYKAQREELRAMRDALPTVDGLTTELNQEAARELV